MISVCISGKFVMGSRKGLFKSVFKIARIFRRCIIMSRENIITWTKGRGIKISHENNGGILGKTRQPVKDQIGAFNLNRNVKVQMRINTYHLSVVCFEHTDGALSGPDAFPITAWYQGGWAQKKMFMVDAVPVFLIKDNVVLPERR